MKNYYFPPGGFGFWYQLGILDCIDIENCKILGSSAGSLICTLCLLDKDDRKIDNILKIAKNVSDILNENVFLVDIICIIIFFIFLKKF